MPADLAIQPPLATSPPPTGRVLRRIAIAAAIALAVWALADVALLIFAAVLLACVLRGLASFVARRLHLPTGLALALVALLLVAAIAGAGYWIFPKLLQQFRDLIGRVLQAWHLLRHWLSSVGIGGQGNHTALKDVAGHLTSPIESALGLSTHMLLGIVVVIITALYLAADPGLYINGALRLLPPSRRTRFHQVMARIGDVLRLWVLGQLIDMAVVGILAATGLYLIGVPAPFALGLLAALLTFVPYLGAIAGGIPAALVALTVSYQAALLAIAVFTLCHGIEGYVVAPLVQRKLVRLPPALTLMAMTVSGTLFGLLGVVLGTPLAAAALVSVQMLYVEDVMEAIRPA